MRTSDIIEGFIKQLLEDTGNKIELRRNKLALQFHCVPSQINYVIATRFTTERGYIVESRRGGGGCIRIERIEPIGDGPLMHIINSIGSGIDFLSAGAFLQNLFEYDIITQRELGIMLVALSDKALPVPRPLRDELRATLLKNMLIKLV